ncbi:MAG: L,D-transpeptidase family protein [Chitinophagaceae bacterium]
MKHLLIVILASLIVSDVSSQTAVSAFNFMEYQRSFPRIGDALKRKQDTLMRQFKDKGLTWPARYIYLRSFKYDSQLEVWVKSDINDKFQLFKTYKVCAMAGTLGPKRMQGDYQVPEGFYYINEFNPKSNYHLSLGLNYPNASDRILSDSLQPGGDIYIHGSCVTTGCIPITDQQIEELYILAALAKNGGQDFIPVHIFPIRFTNQKSNDYLARYVKDFPEYNLMVAEMRHVYQYFEKVHQLPVIAVSSRGEYVVEEKVAMLPDVAEDKVIRKKVRPEKTYDESALAKVVDKLPLYNPGGNEGFQNFLDKLSRDMISYLEDDQLKTHLLVEFIIEKDGKPVFAKVIRGGNDEMNEKVEAAFEKMEPWTPAIRLGKEVGIKLRQTLSVEKTSKSLEE